jgi:NADH-quinone oxidoreductase subunit L
MFEYYEWLLLLFPLLGALLNGFLGKRFPPHIQGWIACGAVSGSLLVVLPLFVGVSSSPGLVGQPIPFVWIKIWSGHQFIEGPFALRIDALSITASMTALIAGLLVHVLAATQTREQPSRHVTLALLNAALTALLALVLADNLFSLLLGWSLTGWCTYALFCGSLNRDAPRAPFPIALVLSDLCLLIAVAAMSVQFASLTIDDVTALEPSTIVGQDLPGATAAVPMLIFLGSAIRTAQFPFQAWHPRVGPSYARATAYGLMAAFPGIYLVARLYPVMEQTPFALSLLSWWGAAVAVLMALTALFCQVRQIARPVATVQTGLMYLGLGTPAYAVVLSFLPAYVLLHTMLQATLEDVPHTEVPGRRQTEQSTNTSPGWMLAFALAASSGLPLLPGFAFYTQIVEALVYGNKVLWALAALSTLLLTAGVARTLLSLRPWPRTETSPHTAVLFLLAFGLVILGLVNLTSTPPLWNFLEPVFHVVGHQPAWWWFGITILVAVLGAGFGYVLAGKQDKPQGRFTEWIAQGYRIQHLYKTAIARPFLMAGRFLAQSVEPRAALWTFGALARLIDRDASDQSQNDSVSLSILLFFLGVAAIAAYLLFQ